VVLAVGREIQRAGLLVDRTRQADVGDLAEVAVGAAGHRDQRDTDSAHRRNDRGQLVAFARIRDRQHDVAGGHHPEVAVAGFGRVDEHRRCAGRCQRRRNLAADVTALAHAHHDDAPAARKHRLHRIREAVALARLQSDQRVGLDVERCTRQFERAFRIESEVGSHCVAERPLGSADSRVAAHA
jgi:hypothetical protein